MTDVDLGRKTLDLLKSYDVLVANRVINEEERSLLDEYVEAGGVVIESQDKSNEGYVWELSHSEVR